MIGIHTAGNAGAGAPPALNPEEGVTAFSAVSKLKCNEVENWYR